MAAQFLTQAQVDKVHQLYVSYFNRSADAPGANYWATQFLTGLNSGKSELDIMKSMSANFALSAEFAAKYPPTQSVESYVDSIYTNVLGRTADAAGKAYWVAELNAGTTLKSDFVLKVILGISSAADTAYLSSLVQASEAVAGAVVYQSLTTSADSILGTSGNDIIQARIVGDANTLQSGDKINAGAGADRLEADIGNQHKFAITPETTGVETVAIRAQAVSTDATDNNLSLTNEVQIDAQRMVGVTQWESNNSRADLLIEDVRILPTQITKDVTIAFVESDPGHVDFGVYFDEYSLKAQSTTSNTLRLQLLDTRSAAAGTAPLKDNPYNGFAFNFNGVLTTVASPAIDAAQTYAELLTAVQAALLTVPSLATVTAALGTTFTATDTVSGQQVTGTEIVLSSTGVGAFSSTGAGNGWTAAGAVPPSSGLHTNMSTASATSTDLVTSKIILDDVGRGAQGGDLVVGALSVGDTDKAVGVQRFEIEVRDNSKLGTISSTDNSLKEVTIVNGKTSSSSFAYDTVTTDKGYLQVNGNIATGANGTIAAALPGISSVNGLNQNTTGFSDVRLIDASTMTGKLSFTSEITSLAVAKYLNAKDIAALPAGDNIAFAYTGGTNADTMSVAIDAAMAGSNSNILSGREDFTFTFNGGAGSDKITTTVVKSTQIGTDAEAWYTNQKLNANLFVNGGDGDDTITTSGAADFVINGDAGNDTVYADNTGNQGVVATAGGLSTTPKTAQYVFNTANQLTGAGYVVGANDERSLNDLKSDVNDSYNLHLAKVKVTFKGLESTSITINSSATAYKTTDLQINQAIKEAINTNAVLSKLLVATDGPANTLIVSSLIDGVQVTTDLAVSLTAPVAGTFSATDLAAVVSAYGLTAGTTEAQLLAAGGGADAGKTIADAITKFTTAASGLDYVTQFAESGAGGAAANTFLVGANSTTASDNTINGGAGNDVIVLGTTGDAVADAAFITGLGVVDLVNGGVLANTQMTYSNDTVAYTSAFGNDTIVHFKADTDAGAAESSAGYDILSFKGILGAQTAGSIAAFVNSSAAASGVVGAQAATDRSIVLDDLVVAANDTTTLVAALFTDAGAAATAAINHIYVAVDTATNIGTVYQVVDAVGAANVAATLIGTIDLADTVWSTLTVDNFA